MREEIKRIAIDEGVLGYLHALNSERDGLRVLNCQIVRSGDGAGALYERFLKEYKDACVRWQIAYSELVQELAPDCLGPGYATEISFLTGELIVYREAKA